MSWGRSRRAEADAGAPPPPPSLRRSIAPAAAAGAVPCAGGGRPVGHLLRAALHPPAHAEQGARGNYRAALAPRGGGAHAAPGGAGDGRAALAGQHRRPLRHWPAWRAAASVQLQLAVRSSCACTRHSMAASAPEPCALSPSLWRMPAAAAWSPVPQVSHEERFVLPPHIEGEAGPRAQGGSLLPSVQRSPTPGHRLQACNARPSAPCLARRCLRT